MTRRFVACGRQTCAVPLKLTLQIVRRPDGLHTFQFLPRRWVVERTLAWITANRRRARDYERLPTHHEAMVTWATTALKLTLHIVRRPEDLHTFQVLPRRWVVERTLAWITRHRRTVRDYERLAAHHETIIYWAMIITMSRRLARQRQAPQPHLT